MKKITPDKVLLAQNKKRTGWHLPSRAPFSVFDSETGKTTAAHEVIIEGAPVMVRYDLTSGEVSVITHGVLSVYDHTRKERKELK